MSDYTEFDSKLLARINKGKASFCMLDTHMRQDAIKLAPPGSDAFRVTDRRLQALRKQKLIAHSGKNGWYIVSKEDADAR